MIKKSLVSLFVAVIAAASLNAKPLHYTVDSVHSGVAFKVRHFLNKVPGSFEEFEGEIHFDPEHPEKSKATATIIVGSVNTSNSKRDEHLQNEDFFEAGSHPKIEYKSTKWTPVGDNTFEVEGLLKMRGVEKPVTLEVTYLGEMEGRGAYRSGWEATGEIDRSDWGITYGAPTVGNEVSIELNIQARRPMEDKASE